MIRCLTLTGAAALACIAQTPQAPTFRAETRLVVLQATVRDQHGRVITDLGQDAFTVYENGTRQPITLFRRDDVPVSIGLLLDNSGSMRTIRPNVERAAGAFARASNPEDEMFVVNFADHVRVDLPMTTDTAALERGVSAVSAIGGTALFDALSTAQTYLATHARRDRKALVVITDGNDNASETTLAQAERLLESSDTVVYAVGLFGAARDQRGRKELDRLAQRTGGAAAYPATIEEIDQAVVTIAEQIRQQYTIGYSPLNRVLDGGYRTIRVVAAGPGRLTVKTRPGYVAARQ